MYFNSLAEILSMGGHGTYVWFCFGLFLVIIALNVWHVKSVAKRLKKRYLLPPTINRSTSQ